MDQLEVRRLEDEIDTAIAEVLNTLQPRRPVSPRITHLMAKAAVTVLEAVEEKPDPDARGSGGRSARFSYDFHPATVGQTGACAVAPVVWNCGFSFSQVRSTSEVALAKGDWHLEQSMSSRL